MVAQLSPAVCRYSDVGTGHSLTVDNTEDPVVPPTASETGPISACDTSGVVTAKVLILFSGPKSRPDNLQHVLRALHLEVEACDVIDGSNLADDSIWDPIFKRLSAGEFAAVFAAPPCSTFSRLRSIPGGPRVLRGISGADCYGLASLPNELKELVRLHNLLAIRASKAFAVMAALGRIAAIEQPAQRPREVSMLNLDEYSRILCMPGVEHTIAP